MIPCSNNLLRKVFLILFFSIPYINLVNAQKEIVLGASSKKGNSNTSIIAGEGIGTKIKTGKKKVKIKSIEMELMDVHPDSLKFFIRLFLLTDNGFGENVMPDKLFAVSLKESQINVDISDLNIKVSGDFMVGLEWADSPKRGIRTISFHSGFLKKGIYYKERNEHQWKKIPLLGINMLVRGTVEPAGS